MKELINSAANGNENSMALIVERNAPLVYSVAKRFAGRGCDIEDLRQIGMIGLIKAVRKFDMSYNVCFSTYAVPLIMGEIKRFLRDDGIVKVSRRYKELCAGARKVSRELSARFLREPTLGEIARELGVDSFTLADALESEYPPDSLSRPVSGEDKGESCLRDCLAGSDDSKLVDNVAVRLALSKLDDRSRKVVVCRYFMDETQQNVAKKLGISQVQVSRIEKRAISALRGMLTDGFEEGI